MLKNDKPVEREENYIRIIKKVVDYEKKRCGNSIKADRK